MPVQMNIERARKIGLILFDAWNNNGILGTHTMPEDIIPSGMNRGSSEHALFITLTVAIDYMRDAEKLWSASRKTFADQETRYLFVPNQVVNVGSAKIQSDLLKYGVALRPNKDPRTWTTICLTLHRHFQGKVESFLAQAGWSGPDIINLIRSLKYRGGFPNLKGPKIAPLWVRMLKDNWSGRNLSNMDKVKIPVDIHTGAATVMTGCIMGKYKDNWAEFTELVQTVWEKACQGTRIYPLQLDEPLWNLSRNGCRNTKTMPCEFREDCTVADFCTGTRLITNRTRGQTPDEVSFETGAW